MSLLSPMKKSMSTRAKPMTPARSITSNGTGRPRTFSASAQKMCPPSSGRNGNRLMIASESEMSASRLSAELMSWLNACSVTLLAPTTLESCLRCSGWKIRAMAETVRLVTRHMPLMLSPRRPHRADVVVLDRRTLNPSRVRPTAAS